MLELKRDLGLTYLYVTHDLATAKFFCDSIAIMYLGRIVECGPADQIYADPKHPYTQALLKAIPDPDPSRSVPRNLPRGEVPDAASPPVGCSFHPRCPVAFGPCGWESRDLADLLERHWLSRPPADYEQERADVDRRHPDPRGRQVGPGRFREDFVDPPLYDVGRVTVACLKFRPDDGPTEPA